MRVTFCELPTHLDPEGEQWRSLCARFAATRSDLILLNEMPFGAWLAAAPAYEQGAAEHAASLHEAALPSFPNLGAPTIVSSRPVLAKGKLFNEAFAWREGRIQALHRKHYFPSEPGFYEAAWFAAPGTGFEVFHLGDIKAGVLLCTELLFNEHARAYGRASAEVILCPRASGISVEAWQTALKMAAIVSGCYVISSNRVGDDGDQTFGGRGMAFAPGGAQLAETSTDEPIVSIELDLDRVRSAKANWPCYVPEL